MNKLLCLMLAGLGCVTSVAEGGAKCRGTVVTRGHHYVPHHHVSGHYVPGHAIVTSTAKPAQKDILGTAAAAGSFSTLVAAIKAAGLESALAGPGPFTVFAPTDEAFSKLPKGTVESLLKPENLGRLQAILKYHVSAGAVKSSEVVRVASLTSLLGQRIDVAVADGKVGIDQAQVVKADIQCSNGIIHVIDSVILPVEQDIVDVAAANSSFSTLVAAVKAAGLVDTLKGDGPFTVFAPNDEAFAKLPEGTIAELLKPENREKLVAILTYHVVPGRVYASDVVKLKSAATANGKVILVNFSDKGVTVNDARVIATDIETSNGVIHVIDSVILP